MARISGAFVSTLLVLLAITLGCSQNKPLDRAAKLEKQGHADEALQIYQSQLGLTPEYDRGRQAELQFRMGECLLALNRTREAFSAFNKAVELDSSHPTARLRLGEMYLLSGSLDHATEQAQAILNHSGKNLDALALLGAAASASGNDGVARNAFEDVLEQDPTRIKVALSLAELLNRRGETETARAVLLRAANSQPHSAAPWMTLGRLEETVGRVAKAEEAYRTAVSIEDAPDTNLRLAQFLERTARVKEAKLVLLHVDALRPEFRTAHADLDLITNDTLQARQSYLTALNGFTPTEGKAGREDRARTIARLIESDLASHNTSPASSDRLVTMASLARKQLEFFQNELDPATREILQAEIAVAGNDLSTARIHADAAVQIAPDSASAQYVDGVVKSRLGDPMAARIAWESALENDDSHVPSRIALAQLLLNQHDFEGAQSNIIPVVREEPANLEALMVFGHVLVAENDLGSAEVIANRAQVAAPNSPMPDLLRGEIALANRDPGNALIAFQKAVLRDPDNEEAIDGLTRAYKGGQVKREMLMGMEKIARSEPASATLLQISGQLFAEHGWNEDAKRCLISAVQIDPSRSSAALQLARVLMLTGDMKRASQYAVLVPGISEVFQGVAAEQRGDVDAAVSHYEAAVRAGDRTAVAANNLAWIYAGRRTHLDRALEVAKRAVELSPRDAGILDTLGFVHLQRREYTDAVKILEHARSLALGDRTPELSQIEQHLRTAYISSGQPELAAALHEFPRN